MPPQTPPSPPEPLQRPGQHAPSQTRPLRPAPVTDVHEAGQAGVPAPPQGLTSCHFPFRPSLSPPTVSAPHKPLQSDKALTNPSSASYPTDTTPHPSAYPLSLQACPNSVSMVPPL